MKKWCLFLCLSFLCCTGLIAQDAEPDISADEHTLILGQWKFSAIKDNSMVPDCPEVFTFSKDGTYVILNECYGTDMRYPVIEKGKWALQKGRTELVLKKRQLLTNYVFHDEVPVLKIKIDELRSDELRLVFSDNPKQTEVYLRPKK